MAQAGKQPIQFWRGVDANVAGLTGAAAEPVAALDGAAVKFYVCNSAGAAQFIGPVTTLAASAITSTAAGSTTSTDVDSAIAEMTAEIDALQILQNSDYIAGAANPVAGDGVDGNYYLNVTSGDIFGPKGTPTAGAWPAASIGNAYSQLGLSNTNGAAPTTTGAPGSATVAARGDHSHPFQTAAQSTFAPGASGLVSTTANAAIIEVNTAAVAAAAAAAAADARTVTGTNGVAGGGAISTNPTLNLDIQNLTAATIDPAADLLGFHDNSDGVNNKATTLNSALGTASIAALSDVPAIGAANQVLSVNAGATALEYVTLPSGITNWIDLSDTDPTAYTGQAGRVVIVNAGETGLAFGSIDGGTF